jgi:hypothetical protein
VDAAERRLGNWLGRRWTSRRGASRACPAVQVSERGGGVRNFGSIN